MLSLFLFFGCQESKPCTESTAAAAPITKEEKAPAIEISEQEATLLKPYLDDIRVGVREWSSTSVGICKKIGNGRDCEEYVGLSAEPVPEGQYMIRGEFQAPKLSPEGGWKVKLSVDCEITRKRNGAESKTNKSYSKEYKVVHVLSEEKGYRLSPMYSIISPSSRGDEKCTWKIEGNNLETPVIWEGTYSVPYKG